MHACIYFSGVYIYIFIFQDIPNICACMGKNVSFVVEIISCYDAKISKNKLRNLHCVCALTGIHKPHITMQKSSPDQFLHP